MGRVYFITRDGVQLHAWGERQRPPLPRIGERVRINQENLLVEQINHDVKCFDIFIIVSTKG